MKATLTLFALCLYASLPGQLYLNEFVASNDTGLTDENGEFEDWVEIYNAGTAAVSLDGYYLTDDLAEPTLWQLPTGSGELAVPGGGYIVLFFDKDTGDGPRHVNAKLSGSGEAIGLFAPDGSVVDTYTYGQQQADVSEGRSSDGAATWTFFTTPTPGAANLATQGPPAAPVLSQSGGLYGGNVSVTVTAAPDATVRYTTNGDVPTTASAVYPGTMTFSSPTALRIAAFRGGEQSETVTETYLIGVQHTFPVVALTAPDNEFYGDDGFYNVLDEDIEIPINAELYEPDGTRGFNLLVEGELQGTASLINDQRSIALKAKGSLGGSKIEYRVFPDGDLDAYRSLTLRNSGQDWNVTLFRDALISELMDDRTDLAVDIAAPQLQLQDYRPSIVYVNGDYWGIYNLRERSDKRYIRVNFGYDDDEIDLMDENAEVKEGTIDAWLAMQSFLQDRDFNEPANFAQLQVLVDTDAYLDNAVFNIYIDNQDWPGNNNRHWRVRDAENGQWQWLVKDLDFSFGLFTTEGWNTGYAGDNSIARLLNPHPFLWPNPEWSTRLFQNLVENDGWRHAFINRLADQRNVLFDPARVGQRIDNYLAVYAPERQRSNQRWNNLWTQEAGAERMREFAQNRPAFLDQHVIDAFDEISGTASVSLQVSGEGSIEWSTVSTVATYSGTYYRGVPVPVRAVPAAGYCFAGWSGALTGDQADRTITLSGDISLTATFEICDGNQKDNQTITFAPLPDRLTTDAPFALNASASSSLPVGFQLIGGPATLAGNTLTLTGQPGAVTVKAIQFGNAQYNPAPDVIRTFQVIEPNGTQDQAIAFASLPDRLTTDAPFALSATASSGLTVGYTLLGGPATLNGNTLTLTGQPGTVVVRADQAGNAQYNAAPSVTQTFTVTEPGNGPEPCAISSDFPWHEWISGVTIGSTSNPSGKAAVNSFSAPVFTAIIGFETSLSLETSYSYTTHDAYFRCYIDYNRDGAFDPATETAYAGVRNAPPNGTASALLDGAFTVPAGTAPGLTALRVVMRRNAYGDPCTVIDFGEAEDYTIDLRPPGNPAPLQQAAWVQLDGRQAGPTVMLEWSALGGADVAYYLVETQAPDGRWQPHGMQPNTQPAAQLHRYRYPVGELGRGIHAYRVTRVPVGGRARTSNVWQLTQDIDQNRVGIAPNPTTGQFQLYLPETLRYPVGISCTDALGNRQWARTLTDPTATGVDLRLTGPRGVYWLTVRGDGQHGETVRVVKIE